MRDEIRNELQACLARATSALMSKRDPRGFWEGRLSSSPLATAVALCAFADEDTLSVDRTARAFVYIDATQNSDGGWGDTEISKSNLAATLLVLSAFAMHRRAANADGVARANAFVAKLGGLKDGLRKVYGKDLTFQVPIRMTAACAGLMKWCDVDALPFELALAPRNLMGALRLPVVSYALPALVCVGLARHAKAASWFLPARWIRNWATEKALEAVLKMQPESGGYLEAIPITAFCMLGLKAAGRADHAIAKGARKFLLSSQREDGSWPVEVHLSVWNTTRVIDALDAGGLLNQTLSKEQRDTTRDWLLAQQTKGKSVYSDAAPGGWGWNHLSGSVPDADDTSGAILALSSLNVPDEHNAIQQGKSWLVALQNSNGGWPTFCRGWEKLPFDRSSTDLTAHALRALCADYHSMRSVKSGLEKSYSKGNSYLHRSVRKDGSYAPLWFGCEVAVDKLNSTYGTAHVLFRLNPVGNSPHWDTEYKNSAITYLRSIQNSDGGFGGCKGAPSSAEETGLALRALATCGVDIPDVAGHRLATARAAKWLKDNQLENGSWKPSPIGFYFAVLWYYEELYPLYYAIGGLGAYLKNADKFEW